MAIVKRGILPGTDGAMIVQGLFQVKGLYQGFCCTAQFAKKYISEKVRTELGVKKNRYIFFSEMSSSVVLFELLQHEGLHSNKCLFPAPRHIMDLSLRRRIAMELPAFFPEPRSPKEIREFAFWRESARMRQEVAGFIVKKDAISPAMTQVTLNDGTIRYVKPHQLQELEYDQLTCWRQYLIEYCDCVEPEPDTIVSSAIPTRVDGVVEVQTYDGRTHFISQKSWQTVRTRLLRCYEVVGGERTLSLRA